MLPPQRSTITRLSVPALALVLCLSACAKPGGVSGHGTIEMDEIDVSSLVGGRVARLTVDEGDSVRAGDTLVVLDRGEITAGLEAQAAQAAQYRDLRSGARTPEILTARAELVAAAAQADVAESDYNRARELVKAHVISDAEFDRARATRDASVGRRDAAREQLKLVETGFRTGQVEVAARGAQAAAADLLASRSRAGELVLVAPIDGIVLLRNFEPGEVAAAGQPIVTIGDPDRLWMRVYIAAPELPRIHLGAAVEIRVMGVPNAFPAHVIAIANEAEFTPRSALTEEERANLVFGVKLRIDPSAGTLKPGLPAEARIAASAPPP